MIQQKEQFYQHVVSSMVELRPYKAIMGVRFSHDVPNPIVRLVGKPTPSYGEIVSSTLARSTKKYFEKHFTLQKQSFIIVSRLS